jgi:hypothetical protein
MADVSKLVEDLSGLTVLEAAELARLLKENWKPLKVSLAEIANGTIDEETRARFKKAADYILMNGAFREPPIAMRLADGLSILDGNHRITAFCGLQEAPAEILAKNI